MKCQRFRSLRGDTGFILCAIISQFKSIKHPFVKTHGESSVARKRARARACFYVGAAVCFTQSGRKKMWLPRTGGFGEGLVAPLGVRVDLRSSAGGRGGG